MRYPAPTVLPGAVFQGRAVGPIAPPGTYTIELSVNGVQREDHGHDRQGSARSPTPTPSSKRSSRSCIDVRDKLTETMSVVKRVRDTRTDGRGAREEGEGEPARPDARNRQALLDKAMTDLNNRLYTIEERLVQYRASAGQDLIANPTGIDSKLAQLLGFASMGDGPPTDGSRDLLKRLTAGIAERATALDGGGEEGAGDAASGSPTLW